jgi:uncharacterized membrane protein YqjE
MEESTVSLGELGTASKQFARRLLTIGENRIELLMVEVQEERERLLQAILLALGTAALALLAGITLTGLVVVLFWNRSPAFVLLTLLGIYTVAAVFLYQRLTSLLRDWQNFPDTLDQFRKDRACLDKSIE